MARGDRDKARNSGAGYNPASRPERRKDQPPLRNVCGECGYHNSHSPTCPENPKNKDEH